MYFLFAVFAFLQLLNQFLNFCAQKYVHKKFKFMLKCAVVSKTFIFSKKGVFL